MTKDNTPKEIRMHSAENIALSSNSDKKEWIHVTDHESALQKLREEKETWTFEYNKIWDALKEELEETQSLQAKVERLEKFLKNVENHLDEGKPAYRVSHYIKEYLTQNTESK